MLYLRTACWLFAVLALTAGCRNEKALQTAKENARQFGLVRCECERLQRQDPPGDITLCSEQMQQARRYLGINLEMGKFSKEQREAVLKFGEDIYLGCINNPEKGQR